MKSELRDGDYVKVVSNIGHYHQLPIDSVHPIRVKFGERCVELPDGSMWYINALGDGRYESNSKDVVFVKVTEVTEFNVGNLVFEIDSASGVLLTRLKESIIESFLVGKLTNYYDNGKSYASDKLTSIVHATEENRKALVTIWGEENVPKLSTQGTPLAIEKLKLQKWGMGWVSDESDEDAIEQKHMCIVEYDPDTNEFVTPRGIRWKYAVLVDNDGDEIIGE